MGVTIKKHISNHIRTTALEGTVAETIGGKNNLTGQIFALDSADEVVKAQKI